MTKQSKGSLPEPVAGPSSQYGSGNDKGSSDAYTFQKKRERTYANNGAIDQTFEVKFTDQLQNKKWLK